MNAFYQSFANTNGHAYGVGGQLEFNQSASDLPVSSLSKVLLFYECYEPIVITLSGASLIERTALNLYILKRSEVEAKPIQRIPIIQSCKQIGLRILKDLYRNYDIDRPVLTPVRGKSSTVLDGIYLTGTLIGDPSSLC